MNEQDLDAIAARAQAAAEQREEGIRRLDVAAQTARDLKDEHGPVQHMASIFVTEDGTVNFSYYGNEMMVRTLMETFAEVLRGPQVEAFKDMLRKQ